MRTEASRARMAAVGTLVCLVLIGALVWVMPKGPAALVEAGPPCHEAADCPVDRPRCHRAGQAASHCGTPCTEAAGCAPGCCAADGTCQPKGTCAEGV